MEYDVFISHASKDKDSVARPLVKLLKDLGLRAWIDEFELKVGDSLRSSIDRGLKETRFGVVILSPDFFAKEWPQKELNALVAREVDQKEKVILPVWHNISAEKVRDFSPILADRIAVSTENGIEPVAKAIAETVLLRMQGKSQTIEQRLESVVEKLEHLTSSPGPIEKVEMSEPSGERKEVFVVHGHDEAARESVTRFVESLGLKAIVLQEQPSGGRTIIEKFEAYSNVCFAIVLLTPDDIGSPSIEPSDQKPRARQNVIFELGYFLGKLGRDRFCILHKGNVELPSDIHGLVYIHLDSANGWKISLARELKQAGIDNGDTSHINLTR